MDLAKQWLRKLRSPSLKNKLDFAEGKISEEVYMENVNKEVDLSTLSIQEVYALRSQARQKGDTELLGKISIFLNGRSGGFGETLESLLAKRQQMKDDLASGKISDDEYRKFLVELHLVNNCPIRNNFNRNYGSTGNAGDFRYRPSLPDLYAFHHEAKSNGSKVLSEAALLDLKLLSGESSSYISLTELLISLTVALTMRLPNIWVVVDPEVINPEDVSREVEILTRIATEEYGIKIEIRDSYADHKFIADQHVVLLALSEGFGVLKARGVVDGWRKVIPYPKEQVKGVGNAGLNKVVCIEPSKLIQGDDRVLVLVPQGTRQDLNRYSLMFWDLEQIIKADIRREEPDVVKNPKFNLMDPTWSEFCLVGGLIQQEIEKSDVVLRLMGGSWHIEKTKTVDLKNDISYLLDYPAVGVAELLAGKSEEVWIYIDHRLLETNECENIYHVFATEVAERFPDTVLKVMSGHPSQEWKEEHGIVLKATAKGFFVEQAPGTDHAWKFIPRVRFGADGKIVSELTQKELTRMSLSRFGFVLVDPDTGLTLSKEEQDKHARGIVASVRSRKK